MNKMTISLPSLFLLLLSATTALSIGTTAFRLELRNVDATPNTTTTERLRRDGTRIHSRFGLVSGATAHVVAQDMGMYIAEYSIGTPPQVVQAVVSTASDLVWTQCSSCHPKCFFQNLDYYDYNKSSTGKPVPCDDTMCAAGTEPCVGDDDDGYGRTCPVYDDYFGSFAGDLRVDDFSFGPAKVDITFGCMDRTDFVGNIFSGASGFLGLGRGSLSLPSQVGSHRFSYCLTPITDRLDSSTLVVGSSAGLNGDAPVTSTAFGGNPHGGHGELFSSGYYISMSGMSIGEVSLDIPREAFHGGMIIDSSFPYMALVDVAFIALKNQLTRQLGSSMVPSPVDFLQLCMPRGDVSLLLEPLVLHLDGGDLALPTDSYWIPVDEETCCLAVISTAGMPPPSNETSILGSYQQQNFLLLFDIMTQILSFQPADCASM